MHLSEVGGCGSHAEFISSFSSLVTHPPAFPGPAPPALPAGAACLSCSTACTRRTVTSAWMHSSPWCGGGRAEHALWCPRRLLAAQRCALCCAKAVRARCRAAGARPNQLALTVGSPAACRLPPARRAGRAGAGRRPHRCQAHRRLLPLPVHFTPGVAGGWAGGRVGGRVCLRFGMRAMCSTGVFLLPALPSPLDAHRPAPAAHLDIPPAPICPALPCHHPLPFFSSRRARRRPTPSMGRISRSSPARRTRPPSASRSCPPSGRTCWWHQRTSPSASPPPSPVSEGLRHAECAVRQLVNSNL